MINRKYVAEARRGIRSVSQNTEMPSFYSIILINEESKPVRKVIRDICHNHLNIYNSWDVLALVENMSYWYKSKITKHTDQAFRMYLDWLFNRSPISYVFYTKTVEQALRHGVVFDVNEGDDFAIRAAAIMLRGSKEYSHVLPVFKDVIDRGYSEKIAFIMFNMFARASRSGIRWSGGTAHTVIHSSMEASKVMKWLSKKYVSDDVKYSHPKWGLKGIYLTIDPSCDDYSRNKVKISNIIGGRAVTEFGSRVNSITFRSNAYVGALRNINAYFQGERTSAA